MSDQVSDGSVTRDAVVPDPAATALIFADREVSYGEFDARVAAVTEELIGSGVGPEVAVAVCIPRSVEMLVAIHAIVAAGGQYVPIDTDAPAERVRYMLAIADAGVLLVSAETAAGEVAEVAGESGVPVRIVDASGDLPLDIRAAGDAPTPAPLRPDHAAYTLFTSGSTGRPKGVTVSHNSIRNRIAWMQDALPIGPGDVVLQKTPYTFDVSIPELFWPLLTGATLVIAEHGRHGDPRYLADIIGSRGVTVTHFVPSMLSVFLDVLGDRISDLTSLRIMFTSGEALPSAIAQRVVSRLARIELHNLYGPTEAAVEVTRHQVRPGETLVPIGRPVANTTAYVLDSRLQVVPAGVPGELYLGGAQVARGYAAQPGLSAERFVADPLGLPGARLYRTGDLVRWNTSGAIEYLGRTDFQVKLRGQRIELGEIESVLASAPGVVHAAATVARTSTGEFLVGYVSPAGVDLAQVANAVADALPEYMRPSQWVTLDEMPLSTAGKVNRKALPEPEIGSLVADFVAAGTELEATVAAVFAEVLGTEPISVVESFFDLGGNSLSATRVVARLSDAIDADVTVRDLFDAPTVRALAERVGEITGTALAPVTRIDPRPDLVPLSFAQQRIWFINQFDPESSAYNIPAVLRLTGRLDVDALQAAVVDVVVRHEVLRTVYPTVDGVPRQQVCDSADVASRLDWAIVDSTDALERAVVAGFDVSTQWPLRARLVRVSDDEHVLAVVAHHIGADGESMTPLVRDVVAAYIARSARQAPAWEPLTVQFADFAIWQHEVLGSPNDAESVVGKQLSYWSSHLDGLPDALSLPTDHPRPRAADYAGGVVSVEIDRIVADRITELAAQRGVTTFMVLHAAFALLLARLSATDDIAIATPIAGRGQRELEAVVGMFVNTLVLRTAVDGTGSFADLLDQVRTVDLDAYAHADVPFETVVEALNPIRSEAFSPLAQVMLSFDPAASASSGAAALGELTVAPMQPPEVTSQLDLTLTVMTSPDGPWNMSLVYATALFAPDSMRLFLDRLTRVLGEVTAAPEALIGEIPIGDTDESRALARVAQGDVVDVTGSPATGLTAPSTARIPAANALRYDERSVTYAEFDARVATLGRELIAAGVGPDVAVAVCLPRSVEMLVAIHAILAAGGQYVPIDTEAPAERAEFMLRRSGAALLAVAVDAEVPSVAAAADQVGIPTIRVDSTVPVASSVVPIDESELLAPIRPDNAAYTLFTSGSTGVPKGVTVSRASVYNRLRWGLAEFGWGPDDRVILKTPYTFDVSVPELFAPLLVGATVVIARPGGHAEPAYIAELIAATSATSVHFVPSMLSVFVDVLAPEQISALTSLRWVFASGEALPPAVVHKTHALLPNVGIHNLFGPTEAAVEVSWSDVTEVSEPVTIGTPVWNTTTHVLDARLQMVPVGVPGELYLGGVQVARGYAAAPALTADRFVADPFGMPGSRLYRTGDLVRRTASGEIEYLGRTDFQVKLRGQRIELGEIEAVLSAAPGVVHAAATVASDPAGGQHLVGYVSPASVDVDAVRVAATESLPVYMVPSVWVAFDDVKLNSAGKLDRRALPDPVFTSDDYVGPESTTEAELAIAFAEVLGAEQISVTAGFFDIGGNSLSAMRLAARAADILDAEVSVRDLFETPTVRGLAGRIEAGSRRGVRLTPMPRPEYIPLSAAQQRMWFINQFDTSSALYNIPMPMNLPGDVDLDALVAALGDVIERHEVLRTVYPTVDGKPYQRIVPASEARGLVDWAVVDTAAELELSAGQGFDVTTSLPIRARASRIDDARTEVLVTVHHIAFDGESTRVFVDDMFAAYLRRTDPTAPPLAPLPVQYADYALWQAQVLGSADDRESALGRQLAHWSRALAGIPAVTDLPADRPRPAVLDTAGASLPTTIPAQIVDGVTDLASSSGVTHFMIWHASLAITVASLAATDDVVIGTPIAGRTDSALERLVGMFVNTLVLRSHVDPGMTVAELIDGVRATDVDAFANSDVLFEQLVEQLAPERSTSHTPLFQIALTHFAGAESGEAESGPAPDVEAKVDLTVTVVESAAGTSVEYVYATALFDEPTIARFAAVHQRVLAAMIADPQMAVGDIDIVGESAATVVPVREPVTHHAVTALAAGSAEDGTLVSLLAQRDLDPTHPAIICADVELSYREFEERTNAVARSLLSRGAAPDDVIAVGLERSVESVVAVWGVIKSGAAYLPIDPAYPAERIAYMLSDSSVRLGITVDALRDRFPAGECEWVDLGELAAGTATPIAPTERNGSVRLDSLAYLIYTSGSTGRPKAVGVSNTGIADLVAAHAKVTGARDDDPDTRVLHVASPSFDAAFFEMIWAIAAGHTLVVAPHAAYAGDALGAVLSEGEVTDMVITPSVLASVDPDHAETVRNLATAGEACPPELVERFSARGRRIFNFYGPSETTVWATRSRMTPGKPVTIGRAIGGFTARVLNQRLRPVPAGVVGELYLSAPGLARGYLGRAGLTASRFVADPFGAPGERMYATGDMVRLAESGDLEFAGRADHQVKINGQRVELGEIESVLADQPAVAQAVVIGVSDEESGRTRLVAYLVGGGDVDIHAVESAVAQRLAAHMVPSKTVLIDAIPLTPAGKLDRRALPEVSFSSEASYVAPDSEPERKLAGIVSALLGRDRVSVTESFFAMGGDSIMSIQLASAAKSVGLTLSPREIFEHKTIRAMARSVGTAAALVPLEELAGGPTGELVLTPITSWMIEHADSAADFADFSQSTVLRLPAGGTAGDVKAVLAAVVASHPMTSASLRPTDSGWTMTAGGAFDADAAVTETVTPNPFDVLADAHRSALRELDPTAGRVMHAVVVHDGSGGEGRVVLVAHHLSVDAVSWPILIEDLATAWSQHTAGQQISLRPEGTSMRRWAQLLVDSVEARAAETSFWLRRLPTAPTFGTAFDRVRDRQHTTRTVSHLVDSATSEALLTSVPEAFSGNVNDALLAALARAVRGWQDDRGLDRDGPVSILLEGHGREEQIAARGERDTRRAADLSRTVGWFTTIAPVSIDPSGDAVRTVKAAKEERLATPDHGIGFGILRYNADGAVSARTLPEIGFNYLGNTGGGAPETEGLVDALLPVPDAPALPGSHRGAMIAPNALSINAAAVASPEGRVLAADFSYAPGVLTDDDVTDIARRWHEELREIVDYGARVGDPGPSPSDVPGAAVTQDDLDAVAKSYPGAVIWPLAPLQQGLYFQAEITAAGSDEVDAYVTQAILRLGGELDIERLRSAAQGLLAAHRVLRSAYIRTGSGAVVAVVPDVVELPWSVVEIDEFDAERVAAIARAEERTPFDMAVPPLVRFVLVRHGDTASLIITNHHILLDGWSGPLVLADLLALYATGATHTGQHASADFGDYLAWVSRIDRADGLAAWEAVLAPSDGATLVAAGASVTADDLPQNHIRRLSPDLTHRIEQLARSRDITPSSVLQFAWAVLLSRLTGNQVVAFGETVSGRPADLDGVETMAGLFINTLPTVVDVDPGRSIGDVLDKMRADKIAVLDHQHITLPELIAQTGNSVLFDTLTVYESYPMNTESLSSVDAALTGGLAVTDVIATDATHYPLTLIAAPVPDGLEIKITYLATAFSAERIAVFERSLEQILLAATADPQVLTADISLLDGADRDVIDSWSVGMPADTPVQTLGDAVAQRCAATPGASALWFADRNVTYREFGARVAALGRTLIAAGVGPDSAVAVCIPRSVELMVAVHGVIAAGGQYVPVDTEAPADRVEYMLATARAGLVLVHGGLPTPSALRGSSVRTIAVDASSAIDLATPPITDRDRIAPVHPDNAAYTLFTSGSTGRPKGVTVSHRSVSNRLRWGLAEYPWGPTDRIVLKTPYTFDVSVPEMFAPLLAGATVVIAAPGGHTDPNYLVDLLARTSATSVHFVPSMLSVFVDVVDAQRIAALSSLKWVFASGEALPAATVHQVHAVLPKVGIHNLFGPTEAAVEVSYSDVTRVADVVTIGRPVWNTATYVLDAKLRKVPPGVPGELYLGGVQLARGYAGAPSLTADRFVADPFGTPGARLYRTGDLVRWNTSGEVEYLGRTDFQVKLRGQRIELGEVEAALATAPGVVHAAATVVTAPDGGQHLVAYLAGSEAGHTAVDLDAVKKSIAARLPDYMRPTMWSVLSDVPLGSTGKLDRRALPEPEFVAGEYVAPATVTEQTVAEIISDVLGVEQVSVTESFFELGGNSLSAIRVAARVSTALNADLSVRDVFEAATVRQLAAAADERGVALPPVTAVSERPERIPLSFAQQRMWFINQFDPESPTYNVPSVMRLSGALDVDALRAAAIDLLVRHEVLRTTFPADGGVPFQSASSAQTVAGEIDWAVVSSQSEIERAVTEGFDVTRRWPIRFRLWQVNSDEAVLAVVAHHIAVDGESRGPLITDMALAYAARRGGSEPSFVPLPVQFSDYAIWQRDVLGSRDDADSVVGKQLSYWTDQLAGLPDVLELPTDRPRPAVASHRGAAVEFEIPAEVAVRIADTAAELGASGFMVVHAALSVLLARMSGTTDIAVGTPVAGRGQAVLDPLVGMFVNTLVLRNEIDLAESFTDLVGRVRATDLEAMANADVPFESVVEATSPVRSEAFAPLSQVWLTLDSEVLPEFATASAAVDVGGLRIAPVGIEEIPAKVDLLVGLAASIAGQPTRGSITYATDLFDAATVATFGRRFVQLLGELTADSARPVGDALLVDVDEYQRSLTAPVTNTANANRSLVDLFAYSVAAHDGAVAVSAMNTSLGYVDLDDRSSVIAAGLVARGVRPGDLVGVATARSVDLVATILGVLKAGAAYLPLDTTNPVERLAFIVSDAAPTVVVADDSSAGLELWDRLPEGTAVADVTDLAESGANHVPVRVPADARAYVIYTSGSTGRPKGVEITHRDVVTLMDTAADDFEFRADDVWTMFHSYAFDFSVWELWGPLLSGGRLVIVDRDVARDPDAFVGLLVRERVTVLSQTPSAFYQFAQARRRGVGRGDMPLSLRYIVFGGEELSFEQVRRWFDDNPDDPAQLVNMYGITETTVHVSFRALAADSVSADDPSFIGRPLASLGIHILDGRLRPVPEGMIGEMYVAGGQLAQSYLNRAGLSAARFVANPYDRSGARMYRTGDLARRVGGDIEYLGRGDAQVQLRGFRIEFGEIEAALLTSPGVIGAAARVVELAGRGEQLIGYVVTDGAEIPDTQRLRSAVGQIVPGYMVPDQIVIVERLPLTANGKLDRKALPLPDFEQSGAEYVAPESGVEEAIAAVFAEVLGVERVSVVDSFFDLGGNSLSATRVVSGAHDRGLPFELRWLFSDPTVRQLAKRVEEGTGLTDDVLITLRGDGSLPPLYCVHPAGGLAWFYGGFAPYIGDRPLYGLQDPHVVNDEPTVTDAHTLAARYVEEIRRVQPHGPYHLLGWSVGGVIAHAMATLLQSQGEHVAYLGIMDSLPEGDLVNEPSIDAGQPDPIDIDVTPASDVTDVLGGWRDLFDLDETVSAVTPEDVASIIRGQIAGMGLLADNVVDSIMESFAAAPDISVGFRPGLFAGSIQVFTATRDKADPRIIASGWRLYVTGAIENVDVDTHHLGMADARSLAVIGPRVQEALERSEVRIAQPNIVKRSREH
ncbi:putative non-ribosomal peptide synthetase [Gordonia effusa NBRC 100432]|uniref:Putative non-ribosomal peptide synthetase n=1 Tax=Gordonia effusa NBRC 100432 TaxID=1077974 RepID=H0R424_9ACTN|nr:non-ribosomal peptide synthetase [Gordonia effusa]GAB19825.1 putative non-ribosomal peptide synthetase [Gordonia effusa NBRC 100432]